MEPTEQYNWKYVLSMTRLPGTQCLLTTILFRQVQSVLTDPSWIQLAVHCRLYGVKWATKK